jgi:hypothetical protein
MAVTVARPMPGTAKIVSVTNAPVNARLSESPAVVAIVMAALRSAWRRTMAPGPRPFARAVRMKSSTRIWDTATRVTRMM